MENITVEATYLINIVTVILTGLFLFIFKKVIMDLTERISKTELADKEMREEIQEVKTNYTQRFERLNEKINDIEKKLSDKINNSKTEVLDKVNSMQIEIIREISQLKNKL